MVKALIWLLVAAVVIAILYFAIMGAIKAVRALVREDDLDEAAELRSERRALAEENDRTEDLLRKVRQNRDTRA